MATRPQRRKPAYARRRRLFATIAASFAMTSLACIPAATARSDHERATTPSTAQTGVSGKSTPQTGVPAKPDPQAAKPEAAAAPAPAASPNKHAKRGGGAAAPAPGEAVAPGGSAQSLVKAGTANEAEAAAPTEQRRSQERAGKATSPHVTRAVAKQVEAARATATSGSGSGSSAPASTPANAAPVIATSAAVPATPAAAASPATSTTQPTPSAPATTRAARTRGGSAHAGARPSVNRTPTETLPAAGLLAAAAAPRGGAANTPARPPSRTRHGSGSPSIVAPLATTITKIVDVVPTPVRALIGALLALALALGIRSRFAARRARRLEQQRGQLLEDVGLLQAALLPVPPTRLGPVGTTAAYRPAAGPAAGGDFYDVFALEDGQLAVIVGDVSGHGRKALPHTALVRFTLRAYLEAGMSPRGAVQTAGSVLEHQLGSFFVTVVAATYNPRTRVLVYASAGHPPPVVIGADGQALTPVTASSSPPIGVGMPTGTRQSIVSIPGRAQICFHTDGVTESRVATELFGPRRLTETLVELGPEGTASDLLDRVAEQADSRPDDMAACMLSIEGDTQAPRALHEELELDRETAASERTEQFLLSCGLQAAEVPAVVHVAAAAAARAGSVVLEVNQEKGRARASLQHDNLTYLQTRHASRQAELTVSR